MTATANATATATVFLPPTPRDFEIHRLHRVEHLSTYALAERFKISQTRVRQLVYRVGQWLASILPALSDTEKEQQARLAQCLAADQLQAQSEKLQVFWEQTRDVKYLRQQTRVISALARLGIVPGAIDAAAADILEAGGEGTASVSPEEPGKAAPHSAAPPVRDCLLETGAMPIPAGESAGEQVVTASEEEVCAAEQAVLDEDLAAMNLLEERVLAMLGDIPPGDVGRRQCMEEHLVNIRRERAAIELRLSPNKPGAEVVATQVQPSAHGDYAM